MKPIKPKKCKYSKCDKHFFPFRSTQQTCFNVVCAKGYSKDLIEKKNIREDLNADKLPVIKFKKLSQHEADARKQFQLWIRMRDNLRPCISCPTIQTKLWDGGHFYKAEIYSALIFTEKNCHKQCRACNRYKHGNELEYRRGLVKRYGESYVSSLEILADNNRTKKWTREEYIEIELKYKSLIKQLNRKNGK